MHHPIHYRLSYVVGISLITMLLLVVVQSATLYVATLWQYGILTQYTLESASTDSLVVFTIVMICAMVMLVFCIGMIYFKLRKITSAPLLLLRQFYGVDSFSLRGLLISITLLVPYLVLATIAGELLQKDPMVFLDAVDRDHLWLLIFAIVIIAPIYEEVLFRGLLFGIWQNKIIAIITSSVLFSLVHFQYDWFGLVLIFIIGLIFGWVRYRYGLIVVIILHMLNNAIALASYYLLN